MVHALMLAAAVSAPPDPYAIFAKARDVWAMQQYPKTVAYAVDVSATGDTGSTGHRHYHEYWSALTNQVVIKPPVSDEQLEHPYKPSPGVNFMGWNVGGPREGSGVKDFIGPPMLSPNYSFGISIYAAPSDLTPAQLVEQIRREYHDPAPQKVSALEQQTGLRTIASVSTTAHAYRIAQVGIEPDDLGSAYHLSLAPLENPSRYRLRDVWIDTATFFVERARIAGNFTDAATMGVSWMIRYRQIGGATYIAQEDAEQPIIGYHGLMYSQFRVSFDSIAPGAALPPYAALTIGSDPLVEP